MLRSIFGFNWKKSPAHCLLLSKFIKPQSTDYFLKSDDWEEVLNEPPTKALSRFEDQGLLEKVNLNVLLDYKYKVTELKLILKERGLPVSGRKVDLIERLIGADPAGMQKAVINLSLQQCTDHGRKIAEEYLAQENERKAMVEEGTLNALQNRRFLEASRMVASFEAQQVFQRGMNIDWKYHNPDQNMTILNAIFQAKPKIVSSLTADQIEHFRIAAGMMYLWGASQAVAWLPGDLKTDLCIDNDTASRMILLYANHQRRVVQYREAGVKTVEVLSTDDSCQNCKDLAKKKYKVCDVPDLPYEKCTNEMGCRCTTVVGDF